MVACDEWEAVGTGIVERPRAEDPARMQGDGEGRPVAVRIVIATATPDGLPVPPDRP